MCIIISGNETFEKLGTIGTLSNLLIYLTTVFNMKSITAATIITVFNGTANLGTLIGAFLCDTYFGRYKTIGFATVASFLVYSGFYNAKSNRAFHLLVCVSLPTNVKHALKRIL